MYLLKWKHNRYFLRYQLPKCTIYCIRKTRKLYFIAFAIRKTSIFIALLDIKFSDLLRLKKIYLLLLQKPKALLLW